MQAIIVDDEPKGRSALQHLLKEYCPTVNIVGMAEDVLSGVKIIEQLRPDLVFLDIEMPNYSGFKLIDYFDKIDFHIIFTTAYEQYALQALKVSATGYLLKPIDIDELISVVQRVEKNILKKNKVKVTSQGESFEINPNKKIDLPTKNGILFLKINEVLYLKSEGRNTHVFLKNNEHVLTTLNLKECEKKFFKTTLLRVHKSHMINLAYIKKYIKKIDAFVEMENGEQLDVGQAFKDPLNKGLSFFAK